MAVPTEVTSGSTGGLVEAPSDFLTRAPGVTKTRACEGAGDLPLTHGDVISHG